MLSLPVQLPDGVTVTQCPLEALFMVRIHVGQLFESLLKELSPPPIPIHRAA
jgi:hypothetical protein